MELTTIMWNDPEKLAISMIRAKFDGLIPEMITAKECLELMLEFTKYETQRAHLLEKQLRDSLNYRLP